jgi:hypothetical protein
MILECKKREGVWYVSHEEIDVRKIWSRQTYVTSKIATMMSPRESGIAQQ